MAYRRTTSMRSCRRAAAALLCAGLLAACPHPAAAAEPAAAGGYRLVRRALLPGAGHWDYLSLDPSGRRLYVAHAGTIQVVDARTLGLLGSVDGHMAKPHGVVALPDLGKGFATDGDPGSVVVFDLKSLKRLDEIRVSPDADGMLYDPASRLVFVFTGGSKNATAIDPRTDRVVKVIPLGGEPEAGASDGAGRVYDALVKDNQVVEIDARGLKVVRRWSTLPGLKPTGMAMDSVHHRLFVGCRNGMLVVMDSRTGAVLAHLPIGGHVDTTTFDPATGEVLDTCGGGTGTLSVVHEDGPDRYRVVENAPTIPGARTMALDAVLDRVYTDAPVKPTAAEGPADFEIIALARRPAGAF